MKASKLAIENMHMMKLRANEIQFLFSLAIEDF
jgi:hypothetical protein